MCQCQALTQQGTRCQRRCHKGEALCSQHRALFPKQTWCESDFMKCGQALEVTVDGVRLQAWEFQPGCCRFYKAMRRGQTPKANAKYFARKKRPVLSWYGSRDNAQWYVDHWYEPNQGQVYTFEVVKPMRLLDLGDPSNVLRLLSLLDDDTASALRCALGANMSEREQFQQCQVRHRGPEGAGYPLIPPVESLMTQDDRRLKRWSDHDVDRKLSTVLCQQVLSRAGLHGYIAPALPTRYGTTQGVFPEEIMTCFQPDVLRMV